MFEVNVCRVCLVDNVDTMYRLTSNRCRKFYENLINSKLEDGLPETFCYICYSLLRKCTRFSNMAQQSQRMLTKLRNKGNKIKKAVLSKLKRPKHRYTVTKNEFVSIESTIQPTETSPETDIAIKEELFSDYLEQEVMTINDGTNNDKANKVEGKIFSEPCAIWINEDTGSIQKRKLNDNDNNDLITKHHLNDKIREKTKLNVKCYKNKQKCKKATANYVNVTSNVTQQHKVENPSEPDTLVPESDNSNKTNPSSSDNDNNKTNISLRQNETDTQELKFKQVIKLSFNKETLSTFNEDLSYYKELERSNHQINLSSNSKDDQTNMEYNRCDLCDYKCLMAVTFAQHIKKCKIKYETLMNSDVNDTLRPGYACKYQNCNFRTLSLNSFKYHKNRHKTKPFYACEYCDSKFSVKMDLKRHKKEHTNQDMFICDICQYNCQTKKTIRTHLKNHVVRQYSCRECSHVCNSRAALKNHETSIHKGLISCKKCNFKCIKKKELDLHQKEVHDKVQVQACKLCDYKCASQRHMTIHVWNVHEGYSCFKCDFKCNIKNVLKNHLLKEHGEEKLYGCDKCSYRANERSTLMQHSLIHSEKGYICDVCNFKCNFKSNLACHMYTHFSEKPLLCQYCGQTFKTQQRLKQHILIHVGNRKISCNICEFKCFKNSVLKRHMRKHTGEKPFECDLCGRRFTRRANLRHHRNNLRCNKKQ